VKSSYFIIAYTFYLLMVKFSGATFNFLEIIYLSCFSVLFLAIFIWREDSS
jgi:hypothetical protein